MSFYVYLPSNGSQRYFPENTASKYRIKTANKFEFNQNEYEVGLVEISYAGSIKTFNGINEDNIMVFKPPNQTEKRLVLPLIVYENIHHLVNIINLMIPPEEEDGHKNVQATAMGSQRVKIEVFHQAEFKINDCKQP